MLLYEVLPILNVSPHHRPITVDQKPTLTNLFLEVIVGSFSVQPQLFGDGG